MEVVDELIVTAVAAAEKAFGLQISLAASAVGQVAVCEGLLLSSPPHLPDSWLQGTLTHHCHPFFSSFLVSPLHSLAHQSQPHIETADIGQSFKKRSFSPRSFP